jgi:hypothetical protein
VKTKKRLCERLIKISRIVGNVLEAHLVFEQGKSSSIRLEIALTQPLRRSQRHCALRQTPTRSAESWTPVTQSIQEHPFKNEMANIDEDRTGMGVDPLKQAILENLRYVVGKDPETATTLPGWEYSLPTAQSRSIAETSGP